MPGRTNLTSASEQGLALAQFNLGVAYAAGRGVRQDYGLALLWLRRAADQGSAYAAGNLGYMYQAGGGVRQDDTEAARWYRRAADQGDAGAQYSLGVMYGTGRGVSQDYVEAVRWTQLAAEQGHALAQANLGFYYADALGVPQDRVLAYAWVNLGVSNMRSDNPDPARMLEDRDRLSRSLTVAEISEAQRLSREWEAGNFTVSPCGDTRPPYVFPANPDGDPRSPELVTGYGTAFVVHPDGLLLTAQHVIDQATAITVSCNGRPAVPAIVRSSSATIDLAVLEGLVVSTMLSRKSGVAGQRALREKYRLDGVACAASGRWFRLAADQGHTLAQHSGGGPDPVTMFR